MASRLDLQTKLEEILGSRNVYFQAPNSLLMKYPAIKYELSDIDVRHADNISYKNIRAYTITVIDEDPDSLFVDKLLALPACSYDRHFESDDLNHDVFTLYY